MFETNKIVNSNNEDIFTPTFKKYTCIFLGTILLLTTLACFIALISWNINDQSLSHTGYSQTKNLMGHTGAIFADMLIQTFGITAIFFLFPFLFWSISLLNLNFINRPLLRLICIFIFISCWSASASMLPIIKNYPLSTSMGGLWGDILTKHLHNYLHLSTSKIYLIIINLLLFSFGLILALFASQIIGKNLFAKRNKTNYQYMNNNLPYIDNDKILPLGEHILGWCSHHILRLKYLIKKVLSKQKNQPITKDTFGDILEEKAVVIPPKITVIKNNSTEKAKKNIDKHGFQLPSIEFLSAAKILSKQEDNSKEKLRQNAEMLKNILEDFGVKGEIINVRPGPVVTLYELEPAAGVKSSRVVGLADDIARSMSAISARVAVVSGRNVIGIELPNARRETVFLRDMFEKIEFQENTAKLPLALGKTIDGDSICADLAKMPHLLVAGTTGSGKSVAINTMILSLLYKLPPSQCRMIMVDPKMLELSVYEGIPHLLTPVVTDPKKAIVALKWAVREMEERYRKMAKVNVRNIDGFNQRVETAIEKGETLSRTIQTGFDQQSGEALYETESIKLEKLPYIVIIIDEMADLMMVAGKEIEITVQRLAQMARAAGIHVIMATQRPSVDVITGTIKANFPTRISFQVTSKIDSRTILGEQGAEQLLGQGDMLFMMGGGKIQRIHGPFVGDNEVEQIVNFLKNQAVPEYLEEITTEENTEDEAVFNNGAFGATTTEKSLYDKAVEIVARDQKASTSYIQRRLSIGYNRAASIIEQMEENGIISHANHAGKREIYITKQEYQ